MVSESFLLVGDWLFVGLGLGLSDKGLGDAPSEHLSPVLKIPTAMLGYFPPGRDEVQLDHCSCMPVLIETSVPALVQPSISRSKATSVADALGRC